MITRTAMLSLVFAGALAGTAADAAPGGTAAPHAAAEVRILDANRVRLRVAADGSLPWQPQGEALALGWVQGGAKPVVFSMGLWLGDTLAAGGAALALAEYVSEFSPGPAVMLPGLEPVAGRLLKVARWRGSPADTAHLERSAFELAADPSLDPLVHHSWSEYLRGAVPFGAPWRVHRLPDTSTPAHGDSLDVPGPDVLGDQMLWCVYHDTDPASHVSGAGSTAPVGVEVRQAVFTFDRPGPLAGTVFVRWQVRNVGADSLRELRAGVWSDPDIGGTLYDDVTGCDTTRSLAYAYNTSAAPDPLFGAAEPAFGVAFLAPFAPGGRALSACNDYVNGTDPANAAQTVALLHGRHVDGSPWLAPGGAPTPYPYSGDPVSGSGWLDDLPGNVKALAVAGPAAVAPGGTATLWAALLVAQGATAAGSVATLRCATDYAQDRFDSGFAEPFPAPSPCAVSLPDAAPPAFGMSAVWPNPAKAGWRVAFTLPAAGAVRVEVFDLAGRRVAASELDAVGAGPHAVEVAPGETLRSGLYFARVHFGGAARTARFAVVR